MYDSNGCSILGVASNKSTQILFGTQISVSAFRDGQKYKEGSLTATSKSGTKTAVLSCTKVGKKLLWVKISTTAVRIVNGYAIKFGADLRDAFLYGTFLKGANLIGMYLRGATMPDGTINSS